ncbi:MAG: hypothetical protein ABFC96_17865 [Thermoguttaceae bacterium]
MIGMQTAPLPSGHATTRSVSGRTRNADLRKTFFLHAHRHLHEASATSVRAAARACLASHGFDPARLDPLPVGLMPELSSMRTALSEAGFSWEEIRASGLTADARLPGRLVGPIADPAGEIVSFWAFSPFGEKPRCLYSHRGWKHRLALCGMDVALPAVAASASDLIVVEEILDALLLHSYGVLHVAAIGGPAGDLSAERWQRLASLGVGRVMLACGDCASWGRGATAAVENAAQAETAPEVYVLPSDKLPSMKSLADAIHSLGVDGIARSLERDCVHGFRYKAMMLLAKHKQNVPWTDVSRRAAVNEAIQFYSAAHPRTLPELDALFLPPLLDELGLKGSGRPTDAARTEEPSHDATADAMQSAVATPASAEAPISPAGLCPVHNCDRMSCFCWD